MLFLHNQNLNIWYPQNDPSYWNLNWSDQYALACISFLLPNYSVWSCNTLTFHQSPCLGIKHIYFFSSKMKTIKTRKYTTFGRLMDHAVAKLKWFENFSTHPPYCSHWNHFTNCITKISPAIMRFQTTSRLNSHNQLNQVLRCVLL